MEERMEERIRKGVAGGRKSMRDKGRVEEAKVWGKRQSPDKFLEGPPLELIKFFM